MTFAQGIDFRATAGFVTDAVNEVETSAAVNYPRTPTVGNSPHVGWEQAVGGTRNRSTGADARLAGVAFLSGLGVTANYRIDLPAPGSYRITLAAGDLSTGQIQTVEFFDGTTSLGVVCTNAATSASQFIDASGALWTGSSWPTNQVPVTRTFATTIFRVKITGPSSSSVTLAHVRIEDSPAPPALTGTWGLVG